jgi:hypothetical protein
MIFASRGESNRWVYIEIEVSDHGSLAWGCGCCMHPCSQVCKHPICSAKFLDSIIFLLLILDVYTLAL